MKVIGVGFGRTGTTSIQRAFQDFGYTTYNFEAVIHNMQFDEWRAVVEGETPDWEALFKGYDSTVSWPACFYFKELLEAFPDAKFILTTRDPERWAQSVINTVKHFPKLRTFRFIPRVRSMLSLFETLIIPRFGSFSPDKDHLVNLIQEHNKAVIETIPPDQLLVYEVKQGWEPLCEFLGHPVPESDFPYENQGEDFIKNLLDKFIKGTLRRS